MFSPLGIWTIAEVRQAGMVIESGKPPRLPTGGDHRRL